MLANGLNSVNRSILRIGMNSPVVRQLFVSAFSVSIASLLAERLGNDVSMHSFTREDANVADDNSLPIFTEKVAYTQASPLAGLSFAEKRTILLVDAALNRCGCGEATLRLAHRYLLDADVVPLLTALRTRRRFTFDHSLRTMEFVAAVAGKMDLDDDEQAILCVGALLHDIGKLSVPAGLLMLQRRLRDDEIEKIRTHPEVGYELVCDKRILGWNAVLDIIRHHHEYLDGTGYPFGLAAAQISRRTRCVTVCDIFSALTEDRPYRPEMSEEDAFSILADMTDAGKLDGEIVGMLRAARIAG